MKKDLKKTKCLAVLVPVDSELQFASLATSGIVLAQTRDVSIESPALSVTLGVERARRVFSFQEIDVAIDLARVEIGAALVTIESEFTATEHVHTSGFTGPVEVEDITVAYLKQKRGTEGDFKSVFKVKI